MIEDGMMSDDDEGDSWGDGEHDDAMDIDSGSIEQT